MVTTLLFIAIYVESVSETLLPVNPLYFLIAGHLRSSRSVHALACSASCPTATPRSTPRSWATCSSSPGSSTSPGAPVRAGFMLLYPISVLSGSVLLSRRGGLALAGLATFLYAGTLWAVRTGLRARPGPLRRPLAAHQGTSSISVFVTGVACATVALIGSYLSESLRHAGEKLEEAAVQVADLRELNEVDRQQHPERPPDHGRGRPHPPRQPVRRVDPGPAPPLSVRGHERARRLRLVAPRAPAVQARARQQSPGPPRAGLPTTRTGTKLDLGVSVSPLAPGGPRQTRLPASSSRT